MMKGEEKEKRGKIYFFKRTEEKRVKDQHNKRLFSSCFERSLK